MTFQFQITKILFLAILSITLSSCEQQTNNSPLTVSLEDEELQKPIELVLEGKIDLTRLSKPSEVETLVSGYHDPIKGQYEKTEEYIERLNSERENASESHFSSQGLLLLDMNLSNREVSYDADSEKLVLLDSTIDRKLGYSLSIACVGGTRSGFNGPEQCASIKLRDGTEYQGKREEADLKIYMKPERAKLLKIGTYNQEISLLAYLDFDPIATWIPKENQNKSTYRNINNVSSDVRKYSPFYEIEIMHDRSQNMKFKSGVIIADVQALILVDDTNGEIISAWKK